MRVQRRPVAGQVQRAAARRTWSAPAARPWGCRPAPGRAGRWPPGGTPRPGSAGSPRPYCTRKLCLVIGSVMPWMSASWKASVPIAGRGHLAGDRDDRHRVHVGVGDRGDQVGRARAGGGHADADLAGGLRVAGGGVAGALLVADQDVPHLRVEQRVVRRQDRAAGDAEHHLDAERLERPDERAGAGHRPGRCRRRRPVAPAGGGGGGAPRPVAGVAAAVGEGLGRGSRHGGSGLRLGLVMVAQCDRASRMSEQQKSPRADARGLAHSRVEGECAQVSTRQRPDRRHGLSLTHLTR